MSNPSTVWAQLSLPLSPVGSLPFVGLDGVTITTDVGNFKYTYTGDVAIGTGTFLAGQLSVQYGLRVNFADTTAVPGNAVINNVAGRVKFAAAASVIVVTCSKCFANSIIRARIEGAFDATAQRVQVTAQAAGSFTLALNAAATLSVVVSFDILNVY